MLIIALSIPDYCMNVYFLCFRGDATHTGHVLGPAVKRSVLPEPERSLPPSGCALLRLLLHAVLVWSSSNADGVSYNHKLGSSFFYF